MLDETVRLIVLAEAANSVVLVAVVWANGQIGGKDRIMIGADGCGGGVNCFPLVRW